MKATNGPLLVELEECWVEIEGRRIVLKSLPEISDSKSVVYNDEPVIGRASPPKTYSHSENRTINVTFHFYVIEDIDIQENILNLRAIQSACYPRSSAGGAPFLPPPICRLKFGAMLGSEPLCVVLKNYSVRFPTDVPFDEEYYCPWRFDLETSWDVVYKSTDLPGQERIFRSGR